MWESDGKESDRRKDRRIWYTKRTQGAWIRRLRIFRIPVIRHQRVFQARYSNVPVIQISISIIIEPTNESSLRQRCGKRVATARAITYSLRRRCVTKSRRRRDVWRRYPSTRRICDRIDCDSPREAKTAWHTREERKRERKRGKAQWPVPRVRDTRECVFSLVTVTRDALARVASRCTMHACIQACTHASRAPIPREHPLY